MRELEAILAYLRGLDGKSLLELVGKVGTFILFVLAVLKYWQSQKWKKAEFLAKEMTEFLSNPRVKKTLILIDWQYREFNLIEHRPGDKGWIKVTRHMQTMALRPHSLLAGSGSDKVSTDPKLSQDFEEHEVEIRDCYGAFLDGLERFSSYVKTGLIGKASLTPYIGYWIDEISKDTKNVEDAAWRAALLTYIKFYRFDGVLWLFDEFRRNIGPESKLYISLLKRMTDQDFASQLADTVKCEYPRTPS